MGFAIFINPLRPIPRREKLELSEEDWELLELVADLMDHLERRVRELRGAFEVRAAS